MKKCAIEIQIHFFGAINNKNGIRPDPSKVEAIKQPPSPTNITDLQKVLGIITYLAPFIAAPPRLQRMLLRLQEYDLSIIYRPGKEMTPGRRILPVTKQEN